MDDLSTSNSSNSSMSTMLSGSTNRDTDLLDYILEEEEIEEEDDMFKSYFDNNQSKVKLLPFCKM
jgi:hypothetical protein